MAINFARGVYDNSLRLPENVALCIGDLEVSYRQLREMIQPIAGWLRRNSSVLAPRVGILASRSLATYTSLLATCWAGGTYVPISTKLPEDRLVRLLDRIRAEVLVVDSNCITQLSKRVLAHCPRLLLAPDLPMSVVLQSDSGREIVLKGRDALPNFDPRDQPCSLRPEDIVYIIFTSGTTGVPKGVMIPASAASHFVSVMLSRYAWNSSDRVAGMTELTFDISVFDMFVTWSCGASLHVVPATQLMAPAAFVNRQGCTVIFTVPSVISGMNRMKMLPADSMPTLRYSFFAGEPLPVTSATLWKQAAPHSVVDDLFGPTEATVVCIGQRFTGPENATPNRGVVAIGTPFPGTEVGIVDSSLQFLPDGEPGELLLAGPQLAAGYFDADDLDRISFCFLEGRRWYRTGDLAYRDSSGTLHHLGRMDNQVKVRGLRVELEEIEACLREIYGTDSAAAVGWPTHHGSANGIVAFVSMPCKADDSDTRLRIQASLPSYMVPSAIHRLESLPRNINGKLNRSELLTMLQEGKL